MLEFLLNHYDWLRALHVIAVIAWMAGMLYLPRLFVYHADAAPGSDKSETFSLMERRLLKIIMAPASVAAWLSGGLMLWADPFLLQQPWMRVKLAAVILLTGLHHVFAGWAKDFAAGKNARPAKFYRWWNEAPTVLMIVIVIMVIVRPF